MIMASLSQSSFNSNITRTTVPEELVLDQDDDFLDEIDRVNDLYFGNIEPNTFQNEQNSSAESSDCNDSDTDILSQGHVNDTEFEIEQRDVDLLEQSAQSKFHTEGCGCIRLYGKPCSTILNWETLVEYRNHCLETEKKELDLMIKIQLFHHRKSGDETCSKKRVNKERVKARQTYVFNGKYICRSTFAFAHGVQRKTIDRIAKSLDNEGLVARRHGNFGKTPKHALTVGDVNNVTTFLNTYANKYGLPLPGRLPNYREGKTTLLPSDKSKADIHNLYLKAAEDMQFRKICLSEFRKIWLEQCPQILVMKPATDLCHKCQGYVTDITKGGNLSEEQKTEKLKEYQDHLDKVKTQRDHYREQCENAKSVYKNLSDERKVRGQPVCSSDICQHYSFDYAQQIHYPHYAQQVGPLFFKTPRKCQCFGVCAEGSGSQTFYLMDEEHDIGKGANSVASMLHHHLQHHGYGESQVCLHMDNCSGQNKNNIVIGYGMWRILSGLHSTLEFSLMEAGHTKFHPDWHFGLWKVKWRNASAETIEQVAATVKESSRNGHNIPHVTNDPTCPVQFFEWGLFCKRFFRRIPRLKDFHHFRMSKEFPGTVFLRRYADGVETSFNMLKEPIQPTDFPGELHPTGLDAARLWYLYEQVAPYCANKQIFTMPTVPKPSLIKVEQSETKSSKKRKLNTK
ncbi:uncharacterized protein LOC123561263 [Mercenaria mercenaria]|uniref:uncharacterized protein LOC123561263 n=1 Tax=Mercenaria mercenaria TaxID=6596 RepID=UPI00234EC71D|nr:uncharacterized protein LOC123561263 [Mercenaria mercenaria]